MAAMIPDYVFLAFGVGVLVGAAATAAGLLLRGWRRRASRVGE